MTKRHHTRKKNTEAIERLEELLQDVLAEFDSRGIVTPAIAKASAIAHGSESEAEAQNDVEEANSGEESEETEEHDYYIDTEDIQGAVAEAISTLIKEGLIPELKKSKEPPTLGDIIGVLFGKDSELREQADYFEELISGYEDHAHVDDLKEAYSILESIMNDISSPK